VIQEALCYGRRMAKRRTRCSLVRRERVVRRFHAEMPSRLSTVAADLTEQLEHRPSSQLRRVATTAALLAVARTRLVDPRLDAALAAIREGAAGDREECSAVLRATEELDEKALDRRKCDIS
jgi:hypothetical protein